jgi:hypothetical protein
MLEADQQLSHGAVPASDADPLINVSERLISRAGHDRTHRTSRSSEGLLTS